MGDPNAKKEGAEKSGMRSTSLQKRQQRKAPEPLRRTIAECTLQHSSAALAPADALKSLQDYLSEPSTIDMAYTVLLDHTIAERDRSPPVINKCVAILKKYLFRYVPDVSTLQQIDTFCMELIDELECVAAPAQGSQQAAGTWFGCPVRVASSAATVKALSYVRGVVARHLPVRSPKLATPAPDSAQRHPPSRTPAAPAKQSPRARGGATKGAKGALKTAATQDRDVANAAAMAMAGLAQIREDDDMYIASDVLRWRWLDGTHGSQGWMPAPVMMGSGGLSRPLPEPMRGVNESGAAALLERGGEAGEMLWSSGVLSLPEPPLMHMQIRMVAATKRSPPKGDQSAWEDVPATMRRRARPLFQYRHYSEQQPLRLSDAEMEDVVSSVCGEAAAVPRPGGPPHSAKPDTDVAASVLIKLLIDMYLADSLTAAPLTLSLLQGMLNQSVAGIRVRAFDMVLNLGVHAHLLEPMGAEDSGSAESAKAEERSGQGPDAESSTGNDSPSTASAPGTPPAVAVFEKWLLGILSEMLLFLVQNEEEEEIVWTAGFSCLLYLITDRGRIIRSRVQLIDIRVLGTLLGMGEEQAWAEELQTRLVRMLTNRLYTTTRLSPNPSHSQEQQQQHQHHRPQLDMLELKKVGGIRYISAEFAEARTGEARRNLFAVLFDYAVHNIKQVALASGKTPPSEEHVQAVATVLALADAPDSFVLAFKSAAIGVGDSIAHSIFTAMARDVTSGRLNADLLTEITGALDAIASLYGRVDPEFQSYLGVTLSVESQGTADAISPDTDTGLPTPAASGKSMDPGAVAQSWSVLRTLLHSHRSEDRANGRVWLLELLTVQMARGGTPRAGPSGSRMTTADLQRQLSLLQSLNSRGGGKHKHQGNGSSEGGGLPTVSGAVRMLCGLLRARRAVVRRGFVHVLEQLLLQCQRSAGPHSPDDDHDDNCGCHERALSMLALMNGALWQLVASKDLDRVNILQMCKMMLSQLCVRRAPENALYFALSLPAKHASSSSPDSSNKHGAAASVFRSPLQTGEKKRDGSGSGGNGNDLLRRRPSVSSVPLATQFLQGTAAAPRKLLQQMPTALLYWPLMQLAAVPNDSCEAVLATAVGSHGDGRGAGAASDVRAALLLLLIAKCSDNRAAYEELGGDPFFRTLLDDPDARIAYFSSAFLLKRMMTEQPSEYQRVLHGLVFKAQQSNNEKLLENPYLQMRGLLQATAELPKLHSFHSQAAQ